MNIQDKVLKLIQTDDSYTELDNENIIYLYENCSIERKSAIDELFIYLCGYSLKTIIKETSKKKGKLK